jgi:hypothetical protein
MTTIATLHIGPTQTTGHFVALPWCRPGAGSGISSPTAAP